MATKKQNREHYLKTREQKLAKQKADREAVKQIITENEKLKQELARLQNSSNDNVIENVDTQEDDHKNENVSQPCNNNNQTTNDPNMVIANKNHNNIGKCQVTKSYANEANEPIIREQIKNDPYDNTTTFDQDQDGTIKTTNSVKGANKIELKNVKVTQTKDDNNKSVPIQYVDVEAHYKIIKEDYLQRNGEFQDFDDSMHDNIPIIIQGEAGVGKTLSLKAYCMVRHYPLLQLRCSESAKENKLIGTYQLVNGNSIYCLGILTQAIEIANKSKAKCCVIQLDEINTLLNSTMKELNEAVNVREGIYIPALNKTYKLKDDCNILICGTMNPSHFSGTNELNPEMPSRFDIFVWDDLTELQTKTLLSGFNIDDDLMSKLVTLKTQINASYESDNLPYPFDTREIVKFCKRFNRYIDPSYRLLKNGKQTKITKDQAIERALVRCVVGKYKAQGKEYSKNILENIESVFGIEIEDTN